jgi:prevent-host-death family protein
MARKRTVNVHEAKTHLSRLLDKVSRGEEITIAKAGKPIARLVPLVATRLRSLGFDQGVVEIAADFDEPLPEHVLSDFER